MCAKDEVAEAQTEHMAASPMQVERSESEEFKRSEKLWEKYYTEESYESKDFKGRTRELLLQAKRKHRSDLDSKEWDKYEYYLRWDALKTKLIASCANNITRIHGACLSLEDFRQRFEQPMIPCVVQGLADDWPARTEWNLERLRQAYGERRFKCGEDDEGYPIKVKLKHFFRYMNSNNAGGAQMDDSPLYIFDSHFDDDEVANKLLQEYSVPHLFNEDLFHLVGEKRRPPYRWVLFGPPRSGSNVHTDPLGTSAWNTLLRGHKLWTLFPPDIPKAVVRGKEFVNWKEEDDEPVDWNVNILPRILEKGGPELQSRMIQFIQKPGETVFVPTDWHHGVLNLDTTIAVTQNFCSTGNFEMVWRYSRTGRRKMARSWLKQLRVHKPELAALAEHLDRKDNFSLDEEIRRFDARRAAKKAKKRNKKEKENSDSDE